MELNNINFGLNKISKVQNNVSNNYKINFQAKDTIDFSQSAKERIAIISQLEDIGLSYKIANDYLRQYYNTDEYDKLVNGDEFNGETISTHWVNIERNLAPAEAIMYQAYDMNDYYMQHEGNIPNGYEQGSFESENYDLGEADFLPLELAKTMQEGFDISMAGMILKGKISLDEARQIQEYYNTISDNYERTLNLQQAEYNIELLDKNSDKLNDYTNPDKAREIGLLRALTKNEAAAIITNSHLPADIQSLNTYINVNKEFGISLFEMDILGLWDKTFDEIMEMTEESNVVRLHTKQHFIDLQDKLQYLMQSENGGNKEFYEDLTELDSDKFFTKLPVAAIKQGAMLSFADDRKLRQKNIQVLNSMSNELLDKITRRPDGSKGHFSVINCFLNVKDLDKRVAQMEEYRVSSPVLFENMSKEAALDFLSNSNIFSSTQAAHEEFMGIMEGNDYMEPQNAKIIEFPTKKE